jgi:hypothetical protein
MHGNMAWQYGWLEGNAIERKNCYWASVPAKGNQFGSISLPETYYLYRALIAGLTKL